MDDKKHQLYGKRKKRIKNVANPLFVAWLTEWRDEAQENGWNSRFTYGKALASLKKYPLPIACGKDCKFLENIGDKICKMLDNKLAKHIATYGTTDPVSLVNDDDSEPEIKAKTKPSKKQTPKVQVENRQLGADDDYADLTIPDAPEGSLIGKKKRRNSSESNKEYIPAYRSGPYSILLTLLKQYQLPGGGHMSKENLMQQAQPLCDKSLSIPDPGSRYTAWSSMGTLIRKGFVIKASSPAKYSLTQTGIDLAHRLDLVNSCGKSVDARPNTPRKRNISADPPYHGTNTVVHADTVASAMHSHQDRPENIYPSPPNAKTDQSLRYWYVDEAGNLTNEKDLADVTVDAEISVGFLIKCKYSCLLQSGKRYKLDTTKPLGENFVYAYIHNDDADDVSISPEDERLDAMVPPQTKRVAKGTPEKQETKKPRKKKTIQEDRTSTMPSASSYAPLISSPPSTTGISRHSSSKPPTLIRSPTGATNLAGLSRLVAAEKAVPQSNSQGSTTSTSTASSSVSSKISPDFVLLPGCFDIILCVDNCEFYGASGNSKMLLAELLKNGIECDLRKLQVGDFLWVAREKTQAVPGMLMKPQGRELVLDYVIERKRMDDLVSSMIDGRFREQKFRLSQCGLRCPSYLVEEYGSSQHFSISEDKLKQAITNTQVIDGFQVKITKDVRESAAYLTVMTRYLQSHFMGKTLYACSTDDSQQMRSLYDITDAEVALMVFQEFNQSAVKTKTLTVREMFGKQLIQLHGMSDEKARAILEKYSTPRFLFDAYDKCFNDKERENLLTNIKAGKSGRSLGIAQSRQIFQMYCTRDSLH